MDKNDPEKQIETERYPLEDYRPADCGGKEYQREASTKYVADKPLFPRIYQQRVVQCLLSLLPGFVAASMINVLCCFRGLNYYGKYTDYIEDFTEILTSWWKQHHIFYNVRPILVLQHVQHHTLGCLDFTKKMANVTCSLCAFYWPFTFK